MKLVEIIADVGHLDTLKGLAEQFDVVDCWYDEGSPQKPRCTVKMLVRNDKRQLLLDALQSQLGTSESTRIVVTPVEAVIPRPAQDELVDKGNKSSVATREELYSQIEKGAQLNGSFMVLVFLSTVVAAIGLLENNIAVIIGAMVIAPLLGPNIALAFAGVLGDRELLLQSVKTNLAGVSLTLLLSIVIGWLWPVATNNPEILSRTNIGFDGVVLALASGAAAVLSLTTGLASALVGVMVAVALLPPAAVLGMTLASGQFSLASGAALLLASNIVCVNLAANMVFLTKGIKPRTWLEKRKAQQSIRWSVLFWIAALVVLLIAIYLRQLLSGNGL